jgi:hypothetical protein
MNRDRKVVSTTESLCPECLAGAVMKDDYINAIKKASFQDVKIMGEKSFMMKDLAGHPEAKFSKRIGGENLTISIASIKIYAIKPETGIRMAQ